MRQQNYVRTDLKVKEGWNYFALAAEEVYEFTYVRAYNRYEGMDTVTEKSGWDDLNWWVDDGAYKHGKHYIILTGEHLTEWGWDADVAAEAAADPDNKVDTNAYNCDVLVLGCMTTRNLKTYDDNSFGLCMQGWI